MSDQTSNPTFTQEKTFKAYTKSQGDQYAQARPSYHPSLFQTILSHHTSTGGQLTTLLDIGCGPGTTTRDLAPNFKNAIGLDPSEGMIATARSLNGQTSSSSPILYELSSAETLGSELDGASKIADESVDLITASTAAHWFDMSRFWPRAAEVLKPGGTVAFWGTGMVGIHPSVPNAVKIQAFLDEVEERELQQHFEKGNWVARSLYDDMDLPWDLALKGVNSVGCFEEKDFWRKVWGPEEAGSFYEGFVMEVSLDKMEMVQGTMSPIQRWREANPEKVGTEEDVVRVMRRGMERLLHEAGVKEGEEVLKGSLNSVLIMVKKKL